MQIKSTWRLSRHWLLAVALLISLAAHLKFAAIDRPLPFITGTNLSLPKNGQYRDSDINSFRVATYNIRRSKGNDGKRDIDRVATVLQGADIIGLQELSGTLFYGLNNQAEQLAIRLGMAWLFASSTEKWFQAYFGNGFLSAFEVTKWSVEPLPIESDKDLEHAFRNLICVELLIQGRPVTILTTHIERNQLNSAQLKYVLDRFQQIEGPVILMADLNAEPGNAMINQVLTSTETEDVIFTSIGEFWRLDWILSRGFDVVRGGYTPRGISDHAHYWADLQFKPELDRQITDR